MTCLMQALNTPFSFLYYSFLYDLPFPLIPLFHHSICSPSCLPVPLRFLIVLHSIAIGTSYLLFTERRILILPTVLEVPLAAALPSAPHRHLQFNHLRFPLVLPCLTVSVSMHPLVLRHKTTHRPLLPPITTIRLNFNVNHLGCPRSIAKPIMALPCPRTQCQSRSLPPSSCLSHRTLPQVCPLIVCP